MVEESLFGGVTAGLTSPDVFIGIRSEAAAAVNACYLCCVSENRSGDGEWQFFSALRRPEKLSEVLFREDNVKQDFA